MNLGKKKQLAVRTFGVGKERIVFVKSRLEEIKEAITKQDMKELYAEGAIIIRNVKGRKKVKKKKTRKGPGKVRKKVNKRKQEYVKITRKLRAYLKELKKQDKISKEEEKDMRKKIRNRKFNSLSSFKAYLKVSGGTNQGEKTKIKAKKEKLENENIKTKKKRK